MHDEAPEAAVETAPDSEETVSTQDATPEGTPDAASDDAPEAPEAAEATPEAAVSEDAAPEELQDPEAPEPLEDPGEIARVAFAVLLTAGDPVSVLRLAQICNAPQAAVREGLDRLDADLRTAGFPVVLHRAGDQVRLLTDPAVFPYLEQLRAVKKADRLSAAALETLAVVAYRQPVMRAEIEAIRGVKVGPMLRTLLDHKLIDVTGRADVPGRPLQYGTTQTFLDRFGLASIKDLPSIKEFRSLG